MALYTCISYGRASVHVHVDARVVGGCMRAHALMDALVHVHGGCWISMRALVDRWWASVRWRVIINVPKLKLVATSKHWSARWSARRCRNVNHGCVAMMVRHDRCVNVELA